ncbi:MAG: ATP-binding protein [Candidatus Sumerlaeia bacterium]
MSETQSHSHDENRVIDTLQRVAAFPGEVTDLNRLLTLIMQESEAIMDSEASACMLYDETSDEIYFEVALGEKAEGVKEIRLKRGTGIAWDCLEQNMTLIVNDPYQYDKFYAKADKQSEFVTRNMIATPMIFRGENIGALEVLNKRDNASYDELDAKIMTIIADQAAMAISNARLIEKNIQRERLAAIGVAVSGIAHHLKNIILSFKGPIGLIKMALQKNKPEMIVQSLPIMERGSKRMEQSVKEMLDYSKDREPDLEWGNLREIIDEVVEACRARGEESGVEIRSEIDPSMPDSWLDKLRLHDAILNIAGNAVEAHGREPENAWVAIRAWQTKAGNMQIVEISDNGPGIPPDALRRIFQPFFSTKGSKGTGLGLAVAQKVAEENGGELSVESEVGTGTTFTFTVAIHKNNPQVRKAEASLE